MVYRVVDLIPLDVRNVSKSQDFCRYLRIIHTLKGQRRMKIKGAGPRDASQDNLLKFDMQGTLDILDRAINLNWYSPKW